MCAHYMYVCVSVVFTIYLYILYSQKYIHAHINISKYTYIYYVKQMQLIWLIVILFLPTKYCYYYPLGGTDFTVRFAKAFFEPKYKLSAATRSCCELEVEHRAWVEDQFANPPPVLSSSKWTMVDNLLSNISANLLY